ncbi:MAG: class I SAM-dependent methyltransferase [Deltaproteobacteria bacterium]|nr:class I SAM-dependent methyltransferase [Deltaproteobacteria bacterium]
MTDPIGKIKKFWDDRALNDDLSEDLLTHRDKNQRMLEIETLSSHLPYNQHILDIGCGNGFSTALFSKQAQKIVGLDYSGAMIERAKNNFGHLPNIEFKVQDVLNLDFPECHFDVVISQRCLINLGTWENQQKALLNIKKVLKPGGFFLLQEGTRQGREKLNQTREIFGLDRMPEVSFNLDFDEDKLWPFIRQHFDIVEIRRFGLYDLISRVVHPLLVSPAKPEYDAEINKIARRLSRLRGMEELSREFSAFLRRLDE